MTYEIEKDAWYTKFVLNVWGFSHEDFTHICPFFWLSIFTFFVFPVTFVVLSVRYIVKTADKYRDRKYYNFERWCDTYYNWISSNVSAKESFLLNFYKNKNSQMYKFYQKYLPYVDRILYIKCYDIIIIEKSKEKDKKEQHSVNNKIKINKILSIIKPFTKVLIYILALVSLLVFGYLFYKFIVIMSHTTYSFWFKFLKFVVTFLIATIIGSLIIFLDEKQVFLKIWNKFTNSLGFIFSFISIFFEKNCPPIKWK